MPTTSNFTAVARDNMDAPLVPLDAPLVPHPDQRPYPWLARQDDGPSAVAERYLIYQPFAGMCNQFSCLGLQCQQHIFQCSKEEPDIII